MLPLNSENGHTTIRATSHTNKHFSYATVQDNYSGNVDNAYFLSYELCTIPAFVALVA